MTPSVLISILVAVAVAISLPAMLILAGVAFHSERSRHFLIAHGKAIVLLGFAAWGACLAAQLLFGSSAWGVAGSFIGLTLITGVGIWRSRVG